MTDKWVHFTTANHPDCWDTQEYGVIAFVDNDEAKKAEALFNALQAENAALRKELENIVNVDMRGFKEDWPDDYEHQFRMWAQNRARHTLGKI